MSRKVESPLDPSDAYFRLTGSNQVEQDSMSPVDWIWVIEKSLESGRGFLSAVAQKNSETKTLADFLNCNVEGGDRGEKRITSEEILKSLPKKFQSNDKWLLIPVEILKTEERKGQFLERRLFILADRAKLLVMDVKFRKVPIAEKKDDEEAPRINEEVVSVSIFTDDEIGREPFIEMLIPHFLDHGLGKKIMRHYFNDVVKEVKKSVQKVKENLTAVEDLLIIRRRLGMFNDLGDFKGFEYLFFRQP